ncbi:MAG: hypothetical protein WDA18_07585 [Candidatus Ratteibacteria bacterium]|jgi:hypothetical protein
MKKVGGIAFFLFFLFGAVIANGENKRIELDFQKSFDMTVTTADDTQKEYLRGNIDGAFKEIGDLQGKKITLEADILIKTTKPYGNIGIFLSGAKKEELRISLYRGDIEFLAKYGAVIPGARVRFSFKNSAGKIVHTTAPVSFNAKNRYLITLVYEKEKSFSVIVKEEKEGETELQEVWNSGNLKVTGSALFNKLNLSVRSGKGSKIEKEAVGGLFLKAVASHPNNYIELVVNRITITEE